MAKDIPKTALARGSKLLGLAGRLALGGVASGLRVWEDEKAKLQSKIELAQQVVQTLSELKGASMKVGQLLSLDLEEYLPPEVVRVIENLHHRSTFMGQEKVQEILHNELGDKFNDFKNFSFTPLAAASIGQVHTAELGGKKVVIKVQYEGVAESIPSDLKILKSVIGKLNLFRGAQIDLTSFFEELQVVLTQEADYERELQMQQRYSKAFHDSAYRIPRVFESYTTKKVLTQEYIEGETLTQWLQRPQDALTKERFSDLLMKLYLEEFFIHGLVQTDPNPGNFIVTPEGKLALLDFGAVKTFDRAFVTNYRHILTSALNRDEQKVLELSEGLGFIDPRESEEVKKTYLKMMDLLIDPFRSEGPFDFKDRTFLEESRKLSWELTSKGKFSAPPKDLLFLHRKLVGVFLFIKKMETKLILRNYWGFVETK